MIAAKPLTRTWMYNIHVRIGVDADAFIASHSRKNYYFGIFFACAFVELLLHVFCVILILIYYLKFRGVNIVLLLAYIFC